MNPKPLFILFGAQRRVGKDTAARLTQEILQRRGLYPVLASFAAELRGELREALTASGFKEAAGIVGTEDPTLKEKVIRPLLIAYGQARRYFNPNYWVDRLFESSEFGATGVPNHLRYVVIVSDWRFPNEYHRLVELAGKENVLMFTLERPGVTPAGPEEIENAPLCAAIAGSPILNFGTVEDLRKDLAIQFVDLKHPSS